jgi:hypothetical protein
MERIVVVSSNNNPDYLFFAPYIEKAWNSYGWTLAVAVTHDVNPDDLKLRNPKSIVIRVQNVEGLRTETQAQAGRLYAANFLPKDALIMTSDMDLLPLQDYWKPNPNNITIYGHDLTWRSFFPMGYCAMTGENWTKYLNLTGDIENDLLRDAKDPNIKHSPFSPDWEQWWNFDWELLTLRLMPYKDKLTFMDRGQINIAGATLAKGRVDRYNWKETQNQPDWIDAHCHNNNVFHPDKLNDFLSIFEKIHGKL